MFFFRRRSTYVYGRAPLRWRKTRFVLELVLIVVLAATPIQLAISRGYLVFTTNPAPKPSGHSDTSSASIVNQLIPGTSPQAPAKQQQAGSPLAPSYGIAAGGGLTYIGNSELDVYFGKLKDLGVSWVRWDLDWGQIQPINATSYTWDVADRVVNASKKYHIASLVIITGTPAWARQAACASSDVCSPANPNAFATFAAQAVTRYKDQVHDWEIWNEPNYKQAWLPAPDTGAYVALLKPTYAAIKQVDSSANVLSGGLAASGDDDGNISPLTFVTNMYAAGAQASFSGVAVHPYSYPVLPSYIADWNRWQQLVPIHTVMSQHGDGAKKVWITEYGAPTGGPGTAHSLGGTFVYGSDYMTEAAQSEMLSDAVSLYKGYSAWAGPFFWYSLQDHTNSQSSPEDFFGLLRADGSKKPAYSTFQQLLR